GGGGGQRPVATRVRGRRVGDRAAAGRRDDDRDGAVRFAGAGQHGLGVAGQAVRRRGARVVDRIVLEADAGDRGGVVFDERTGGGRRVAGRVRGHDLEGDGAVRQARGGHR